MDKEYELFNLDPKVEKELEKAISMSRCESCAIFNCKGIDLYGKCLYYKKFDWDMAQLKDRTSHQSILLDKDGTIKEISIITNE